MEISQFSQELLFQTHGECSMTQIKELLILMSIEICLCVCHCMIEIMLKIMLIMSTQLNFGSIKELGKSFRLLFLLHLPVCLSLLQLEVNTTWFFVIVCLVPTNNVIESSSSFWKCDRNENLGKDCLVWS